ncbi:MAG: kelch repeat-containing protein [Planctomycetes bacterium]|jgi:hypothetical protein|nr:kelch repeat-containing protein [Planctomycetota bacterium]
MTDHCHPRPFVPRCSSLPTLLLLGILATSAAAQAQWSQLTHSTPPSARQSARFTAFDTVNDRIVLFGGSPTNGIYLNDTHVLQCSTGTWTQITGGPAPQPRYGHSLTYDPVRNEVILFGGLLFNGNGPLNNETWAFRGNTWVPLAPAQAPAARFLHSTVFDTNRGVIVLFGGGLSATTSDTWEWNGNNWIQRATTIPSPFPLRSNSAIAYDPVRQRTVIFGGRVNNSWLQGTLEWDGAVWTNVTPAANNPPGRAGAAMAYHAGLDRIVMFGGVGGPTATAGNYLGDTWYWDGTSWTQVLPGVVPSPRASTGFVYDPVRDRGVMFGGNLTSTHFNSLWAFQSATPARLVPFGQGCVGSVPAPTLTAADHTRPWLGDSYGLRIGGLPPSGICVLVTGLSNQFWNGLPLPLDLTLLGMPACDALVSPDLLNAVFHQGSAVVTTTLPLNPAVAGLSIYQQALVFHPGALNPLGALTSNGIEAELGLR